MISDLYCGASLNWGWLLKEINALLLPGPLLANMRGLAGCLLGILSDWLLDLFLLLSYQQLEQMSKPGDIQRKVCLFLK